jgi:hypothetical protein
MEWAFALFGEGIMYWSVASNCDGNYISCKVELKMEIEFWWNSLLKTLRVFNEVRKVVWPGLCCYLHRVFVTGVGASRSSALTQLFNPQPTPSLAIFCVVNFNTLRPWDILGCHSGVAGDSGILGEQCPTFRKIIIPHLQVQAVTLGLPLRVLFQRRPVILLITFQTQ